MHNAHDHDLRDHAPRHYAGCDVSKDTLDACFSSGLEGEHPCYKQFENSPDGHARLVTWLSRKSRPRKSRRVDGTADGTADDASAVVRLVLEATGNYSFDLTLALYEANRVELMVVNPRAARNFAGSQMTRSKTDRVDARTLCEYAQRMAFVPWQPPETAVLDLRGIARRMQALTVERTRERNRLGHARATASTPAVVINDIEVNLRHLTRRLELLQRQAMKVVRSHTRLLAAYAHVTSVRGIGEKTAVMLLPELLILPEGLSVRQWVAHAGLDPKKHTSGTSVEKRERISKVGNTHIRRALYMPALVAVQREPHVGAFYERLVERGKPKMVAVVAVMRKLLHAIYGMLKHDADFDGEKFYRMSGRVALTA